MADVPFTLGEHAREAGVKRGALLFERPLGPLIDDDQDNKFRRMVRNVIEVTGAMAAARDQQQNVDPPLQWVNCTSRCSAM
jgi:hypothetical protein